MSHTPAQLIRDLSSRPERPGFFLRAVLARRVAKWRDLLALLNNANFEY